MSTLIIAEAGVNHNGSEELAFRLVEEASKAGADIVKFQTFKASKLVTESAKQASYQVANTKKQESQLEMLSRLELDFHTHRRLLEACEKTNIEFLSTAFDNSSLRFLVDDLGIKRLKVPSGEITNAPFLLEHARTGLDIILSTGMATLSEIETALGILAFGYLTDGQTQPAVEAFQQAYCSEQGRGVLKNKVTILHCTTEYPAPPEEINLKAMDSIKYAFGLNTGYSDHSEGIHISVAAVARGARVIEKHFTLDKALEGPDHKASLEPQELSEMISSIRDVEVALGDGIKRPFPSEVANKAVARKSIVAAVDINIGDQFSEENIEIKRPGGGLSPINYWDILGKKSSKTYSQGELINE